MNQDRWILLLVSPLIVGAYAAAGLAEGVRGVKGAWESFASPEIDSPCTCCNDTGSHDDGDELIACYCTSD